jgi:malonyl-CoA O-methyltransferase
MVAIDRNRVRRSFGRQALEYDKHIDVQSRVVERLVEILSEQDFRPDRILDIGTGTGALPGRLSGAYPGSSLYGIDLAPEMSLVARQKMPGERKAFFLSGDAEMLPFTGGAFDLVVSSSTFQWLDSLDTAFAEAFRVLSPGGTFCFALFGGNTLCELKNSFRRALESCNSTREDHSHDFRELLEVKESLVRAGFADCRANSEKYLECHEDVPAVLRSLKKIGAGNAARPVSRGLAGRRVIQCMIDLYGSAYSVDGQVPATYEVFYAMGRKCISAI